MPCLIKVRIKDELRNDHPCHRRGHSEIPVTSCPGLDNASFISWGSNLYPWSTTRPPCKDATRMCTPFRMSTTQRRIFWRPRTPTTTGETASGPPSSAYPSPRFVPGILPGQYFGLAQTRKGVELLQCQVVADVKLEKVEVLCHLMQEKCTRIALNIDTQ